MSIAASWELQKAVHAHLLADIGLAVLVSGRIYDDVPQGTAFPYVTLGAAAVRNWSTASDTGAEHQLTFGVWSRYAGRKELKNIMSEIATALEDTNLTLTGFTLVNMRFLSAEMNRGNDGETYEGTIRFRAVTEQV